MIQDVNLEGVVRQYVTLGRPNGKGWEPCTHIGCDHGRKGDRAAFNFNEHEGVVSFHCFNCGVTTGYNPQEHASVPKKMKRVLSDFGIPEEEWNKVLFTSLAFRTSKTKQEKDKNELKIVPREIQLPTNFYPLSSAATTDKWAMVAREYLETERGIDHTAYPFYLAEKTGNGYLDRWTQRLIIPIYKGNKLIYWQARAFGEATKKYLSPDEQKDRVMYGYDELFKHTTEPLFVVEGWFDAFVINGVAVLGNELSPAQLEWLKRSPRRKIYIPDRLGNGYLAADKFIKLGWEISIPDTGSIVKDMNDAVVKYGKLYTINSILENASSGFKAQTQLGILCK